MRKVPVVALFVACATILGATVLREPIARAAQTVNTNIIGPLDATGNVKVHEQGTVVVRDDDNPARHAFQRQVFPPDSPLAETCGDFNVPRGKRLVIQFWSAYVWSSPDENEIASLVTTVDGFNVTHRIPLVAKGSFIWAGAQDGEIYADQGVVNACLNGDSHTNARISISGYLVDMR